MSVTIKVNDVVKKFEEKTIINQLNLTIQPGELFTLLGPSGCGKTTLLRMIIGFNSIDGGTIEVNEKVINNIPVNKRNMGMVFQNYAIFPHMNVRENIAFGLKNKKISKDEMNARLDEIIQTVKLNEYENRMPEKLSGGQQQRVALARAIVIHPEVLLMDEPLSNLDAKLRIDMRNAIREIQQEVGITTVYVTHDQEEALAISDRIAVMNEGVIQQVGSPQEIYDHPSNLFVANFIGTSNTIHGKLVEGGTLQFNNSYQIQLANCPVKNQDVLVSVRPNDLTINQEGRGIKGAITKSIFLGMYTTYFIELENGDEIEVVEFNEKSDILPKDTVVYLTVNEKKVNIYDVNSKENLLRGGETLE
ncbi:polyamine ABC transporter ATP-binding protein [Lysinibacillus sp. 2017]|uniref:ABC transporter ATP-binding protein n=1 Tax=unclassified Lysinibacillus TaxID=2636778 RepID=UPI000D5290FD|nr:MULTISPECIES: ABC transporter ATP-binding protein [unclassified Lysinibacillus]AWE07191.1 polyamine ABC transporter ATP-binding protein [Lysinibacillus sp. 2017]TGN34649.1 ABC transporter ATP-binding protein [Lysinibacillus sp. S2017]